MKVTTNFYLKERNGQNETLINLFVSCAAFGKNRLKWSTGETIEPRRWNDATQRVTIENKDRRAKEFQRLNNYLDRIAAAVRDFADVCNISGDPISMESLKAHLSKNFANNRRQTETTTAVPKMFDFIADFMKEKEQQQPKLADGTLRKYRNAIMHLENFTKDKRRGKLDFFDVEQKSFIKDFHNYCFGDLKHSANNVNKLTVTLNSIFVAAKERGYLSNDAVKKFVVRGETADAISLTESDLADILAFDLSKTPRLEKVRDLFLFGCWTGLRFEDWTKITRQHITEVKNDDTGETVPVIKFLTSKTKTLVWIYLFPTAQTILEKYDYQMPMNYDGQKPVSNQKTNAYLKELFELMEWTNETPITKSIAGKRVEKTFRRCDLISSHTARRTFITNMIERGMNYEMISSATGHKDFDSFKKYNKLKGDRAAVKMFTFYTNGKPPSVPRVAPLSIAK